MKYIIGKNKAGILLPLVFDAHIRHKDVAKVALQDCDIISAACMSVQNGNVICCGESRSLNAGCMLPFDEQVLTQFLFGNTI